MSEELEVYDLDGKFIKTELIEEYNNNIINEYNKTGVIITQVRRVICIIMNSEGNILLQKRSKLKKDNPGMYDKSIGGHFVTMPNNGSMTGCLSKELSDLSMVKKA